MTPAPMDGTDLLDRHVAALGATLRGPGGLRRDVLAEVRDGLHDAAQAHRARGRAPADAAAMAVAEFGPVDDLAPLYQAELTVAQARRTALVVVLIFPALVLGWDLMWSAGLAWPTTGFPPPAAVPLLARVQDALGATAAGLGLLVLLATLSRSVRPRLLAGAAATVGLLSALLCVGTAVAMNLTHGPAALVMLTTTPPRCPPSRSAPPRPRPCASRPPARCDSPVLTAPILTGGVRVARHHDRHGSTHRTGGTGGRGDARGGPRDRRGAGGAGGDRVLHGSHDPGAAIGVRAGRDDRGDRRAGDGGGGHRDRRPARPSRPGAGRRARGPHRRRGRAARRAGQRRVGGELLVRFDTPVWEHPLEDGLRMLRLGVDTHLVTAHHAFPLLLRTGGGLVVEVTDGTPAYNDANYRLSAFYDLAKIAPIRLARSWAHEIGPHGATAVCVTPGWLRSEMMLDHYGVTEQNWRDACAAEPHFAISETPRFVGRGIAALAADPDRARWQGAGTFLRRAGPGLRPRRPRRLPARRLALRRGGAGRGEARRHHRLPVRVSRARPRRRGAASRR